MKKALVYKDEQTPLFSHSTRYPFPFRVALRLKGALHLLGLRKQEPLLPRLLFMGADPGDVIATLSAIHTPEDWPERWCKLARSYEEQGYAAIEQHSPVSAADALRRATIYYRIAEYMVGTHDERVGLWRKVVNFVSRAVLRPFFMRSRKGWSGIEAFGHAYSVLS